MTIFYNIHPSPICETEMLILIRWFVGGQRFISLSHVLSIPQFYMHILTTQRQSKIMHEAFCLQALSEAKKTLKTQNICCQLSRALLTLPNEALSTLHYTTLHYTTHYTTLHYTTLHCTTLHYTTLHYTTLQYTSPWWPQGHNSRETLGKLSPLGGPGPLAPGRLGHHGYPNMSSSENTPKHHVVHFSHRSFFLEPG